MFGLLKMSSSTRSSCAVLGTIVSTVTGMLILGFAGGASAASYGTFVDPTGTVSYENVQDVSGLFGAPTVSLNSLDFTPTNFEALCSVCGPSGATTTDILTLDIQAISGQQISVLSVNEGLDYILQSFTGGGFASVLVTASLFIDITEINGLSVNNINSSVAISYTPSNNVSVFGTGIDTGILLGTTGAIDIQSIIAAAGATGEATRVSISLDNTLSAFHDGAGQALIRKRDTDFLSVTINGGNPVPEPSTALLLMGGLAALVHRSRKA